MLLSCLITVLLSYFTRLKNTLDDRLKPSKLFLTRNPEGIRTLLLIIDIKATKVTTKSYQQRIHCFMNFVNLKRNSNLKFLSYLDKKRFRRNIECVIISRIN